MNETLECVVASEGKLHTSVFAEARLKVEISQVNDSVQPNVSCKIIEKRDEDGLKWISIQIDSIQYSAIDSVTRKLRDLFSSASIVKFRFIDDRPDDPPSDHRYGSAVEDDDPRHPSGGRALTLPA